MTWNPDLAQSHYQALGQEFYGMGYNLINGPVQSPNGRVAWSGRLAESISPEPYLSGIMEASTVAGFTSAGVVAVGRHFAVDEQETNREVGGYSSYLNEKTLMELYTWPFADSIRAGMMGVMCSLNGVNGEVCCENSNLLNDVLKTKLGFPGLVLPDVSAQQSSYGSANAGLDYGSSAYWSDTIILDGIANGNLTQARLNDMATRVALGYYYADLNNGKQPSTPSGSEYRNVRGNHSAVIKQVAREAIVLLKNNRKGTRHGFTTGLPIGKPHSIALFGAHAGPVMAGPNEVFSVTGSPAQIYPGHLAGVTGSGEDSFPYVVDPHMALTMRAINDGTSISWIMNDTYTSPYSIGIPGQGAGTGSGGTPSFQNYASSSDVCLVFINAWSGEGADRTELSNPGQDAMVNTVADNCNNTIVVASVAGPRVLDAWIEHPNVTAVLYSALLGQDSGNAITDVLYGAVNPSGKLTYTIAKDASDYIPVCPTLKCNYTEGVFIDYRYFNEHNISVRYPFGYGLSYTSFTYSEFLAINVTNQTAISSTYPTEQVGLGGETDLFDVIMTVAASVENSGKLDGAEIVQLYVRFPEKAQQPARILRGFSKVQIGVGQSAQILFSLRRRDLSYWDTDASQWAIATGEYVFEVGASSHDIRATQKFVLDT
ncbi:glycoside hydrolase superfamily [Xylariales sp. PMI_506]|nr:glycoside hydrolase superfamily [Xylariales sp. PMI_506]